MRRCVGVILVCVAFLSAVGQTPPSNYQPGTIMAVTAHHIPGQSDTDVTQYEVSVKVENVTYRVLFIPANGSDLVKYSKGEELLVLVGSDTLTFNSQVSGKTEVSILSRETLPPQTFDVSKAPGQYFSMKLRNLQEKLALTSDQQNEIRPILEQEAGEVSEIFINSALSSPDKLKRYEKIVRGSDGKIKPLLSANQSQKLQDLRKEQKLEVKNIFAEQKSGLQN
jgi:hypothetical protein